ncbi:FecR family protein [Aquamicrobium lusatiense]|uniref:FecR family protein n=1 Tax=Aquamicrobium lusatiense TaxID=89772 RepID=UPI002457AE24|nr:FecR family protein [Aquamicrobium lusatiense]MDH4990668.1 FecR family protein [Aquamicrobium lusatiense]
MDERDKQAIDDEAVQWFVILRDDDASDDDRRRFDEWRRSDPEHEKAWREVEQLWGGLDLLADRHALVKPTTPARRASRPAAYAPAAAPRRPHVSWKAIPLAACLALTVAAGWQMVPVGFMADYRSGIGERRTVRLDDGSVIELGTASAVDVSFAVDRRTVRLLSGEAFFTVASDPQRPFVVLAQDGQVQVLGTAFNVRIADDVAVAVTHNTVEVSAAGDAAVVTEGQIVHYDSTGVSSVRIADLDTVQAWRHDQLVFRDTPLNQVLAELGRYRRGHIQLLSGDAGKLRVTAVFDARRPDAALDTIARSLNLRVYRATNLLVGIAQN